MKRIKDRIYNSISFNNFICPEQSGDEIHITGLKGSLRSLFLAFLIEKQKKRIIFITSNQDSAEMLRDDLELLIGKSKISFLPPAEATAYEDQDANPTLIRLRMESQLNLLNNNAGIVVATHKGLMQLLTQPEDFVDHQFHLSRGNQFKFDNLITGLVTAGYERCEIVEDVGHLAVRGGIIDIYPWTSDDPVRVEFFGDEVESIRTFNVISQRSIEEIDQVIILPHQEHTHLVSLFDYLDKDDVIALEDMEIVVEKCREFETEYAAAYDKQIQNNVFPLKA